MATIRWQGVEASPRARMRHETRSAGTGPSSKEAGAREPAPRRAARSEPLLRLDHAASRLSLASGLHPDAAARCRTMRSPESHNHSSGAASPSSPTQVETTAVSRGDWIRTSDLPAPSRMRYQAAPRPEGTSVGERRKQERATRIELVLRAWKALVQPLHHARRWGQSRGEPALERTKGPANRALRLACSRGTDWGKPVRSLGTRPRRPHT